MQLKGIIRLISQISRVSQVSQKYVFADVTDSHSKKVSDHESSLYCYVMMKYVFKKVSSPSVFCFLLSLRNTLFTCPAFLFLLSISFLRFTSVSSH